MTDLIFQSVTALLERGRLLREETHGLAEQLRELRETDRHEAATPGKVVSERNQFSGPQANPS